VTSSTGQGRPEGAVLALAKEVEQLRRTIERVEKTAAGAKDTAETAIRKAARDVGVGDQVDTLRAQLGEVAVQLVTMSSTVNALAGVAQQVAALSQQVTELAARLGGDEEEPAPTRPALPSWFEVEAEQAQQMLADLVGWVDTILVRYSVARDALMPCWMFHGEIVEDLLWLRAAWMAAHRDPSAKPHHAADFHDRWMPAVMGRLKRQLGAGMCNFNNHRDGPGEYRLRDEQHPEVRVPATDPQIVDGYARWWVQYRGRTDVAPPGLPAEQPRVPRSQQQWSR
jgi:hypothetical protein